MRVDIASSGWAALERLRIVETPYDLLIIEQGMPGMTGVDLVEEIRREQSSLAVIVICGGVTPDIAADYMHLEVRAVVPKPWRGPDLVKAVRSVLAGKNN